MKMKGVKGREKLKVLGGLRLGMKLLVVMYLSGEADDKLLRKKEAGMGDVFFLFKHVLSASTSLIS